jgi:hypothetical protein
MELNQTAYYNINLSTRLECIPSLISFDWKKNSHLLKHIVIYLILLGKCHNQCRSSIDALVHKIDSVRCVFYKSIHHNISKVYSTLLVRSLMPTTTYVTLICFRQSKYNFFQSNTIIFKFSVYSAIATTLTHINK